MKYVILVSRLLLGLVFTVFGANRDRKSVV